LDLSDVAQVVRVDPEAPLSGAGGPGHTRWHPAIAPVAHVRPGEIVAIETWDSGDAQVTPENAGAQIEFELGPVHPLTGPLYVEDAGPGDLLEVEILDIECSTFGWSALFADAGGLLADLVGQTTFVRWAVGRDVARSEDIPNVAIPGAPFVGVLGTAPSPSRRSAIEARERALVEAGGNALLPGPEHAIPATDLVREEGLPTMPPRELGGNCDIKDLGAGARILLPVDVPGALLSLGDVHFAQGDGELPGLAIEVAARVYIRCKCHRVEEGRWRPSGPVILTTGAEEARRPRPTLITTGISVGQEGVDRELDVELALRNAMTQMHSYLMAEGGYTSDQASVLLGVAVDVRVNALGNTPNVQASAVLPLDIFDGKVIGL
jgi:formamidase